MKSNYFEKKEARLNNALDQSAKNEQRATQAYENSHRLADMVPMGQPILVGHHSEGMARKHQTKIENAMRSSVEASDKAEYYAGKAKAIENNNAISSDNPDAIELLQAKLEYLMATQELYKSINKVFRNKKASDAEIAEELFLNLGVSVKAITALLDPPSWGTRGIPSYKLTNNNANMKTVRDRIEKIKSISEIPFMEMEKDGVKLVVDPEDNRVKLFFDNIPAEEVRDTLKSQGFHWSRTEGAWMKYLSEYGILQAKTIFNNYK